MIVKKTGPSALFIFLAALLLTIPPVYALEPSWTYSSPGSMISGVAVSSDGSAIAVGAEKIWLFVRSGELLAKEPFGESVVMTPNGMYLLTSYGSSLYLFQRNTTKSSFQKRWDYELPGRVRSIDISDDGKIIVASAEGKGTYVFSSTRKLTGSNARFSAVVRVSSSGQRIVGASAADLSHYSSSGTVSRYKDISMISQPDVMEMTGNGATVIYNNDQRLVSVNTASGTVRWNTMATAEITSLALTPAGSKILVGTQNGDVDLFDDKGNLSWSYATNPAGTTFTGVREVALSTDGKIAAAGTYEGKIVVLDAAGGELWSSVTKDHINHIAMSGDGSLVIATGDETVYAFSSSGQTLPPVRFTQVTASPVQQKNTTTVIAATATPKPGITGSTTERVTVVPTTYSIIRTATQGPVSGFIPLLGILGAVFVLLKRR